MILPQVSGRWILDAELWTLPFGGWALDTVVDVLEQNQNPVTDSA